MIIKICGMTDPDNIKHIICLKPDYLGFIFYPPSSRYAGQVNPEDIRFIPDTIKRVGVFVNEKPEVILELSKTYKFDAIQLHGKETPGDCKRLKQEGLHLIKAFAIENETDLRKTSGYEDYCDLFLFDTKTPQYGGSGIRFDWNILDSYKGAKQFLLSGGISASDAGRILKIQHPRFAGIDLNSCFETAPGVKDPALLQKLISDLNQNKI